MLIYYRLSIVKDRKKMASSREPDTDVVWITAHNPQTAQLMALRWYDHFIGKRHPTHDIQMRAYTQFTGVTSEQYVVYAWDLYHKMIDGDIIMSRGFGRTAEEARILAEKYTAFAYPECAFKKKFYKSTKVSD